MLNVIEDSLNLCQYPYERIDGSVAGRDRQQAIDRFTKGKLTGSLPAYVLAFVYIPKCGLLRQDKRRGVSVNCSRGLDLCNFQWCPCYIWSAVLGASFT